MEDQIIIDEIGNLIEDYSDLSDEKKKEEDNIIYITDDGVTAFDESVQRLSGNDVNNTSFTDYNGVLYDIFYSVKNIEHFLTNSTLHNSDAVVDEIAGSDREEQLLQNLSDEVESDSEIVQSEQNQESEATLDDVVDSIDSLSLKMDSILINQVNSASNNSKVGLYSVSLLACIFGSFAIYALLKLIKL